ncbi:Predicted dehydrogenase [Quadrisphaera granulorum]|uniref:Putative dehydrogenase n=1 Tax=Quadrisphaera granulorum TaxID=317664 RepID=A0A316ARA2_9ACTN|nr:Gfo/Idh/MocA family oxidoreductase [Quadrisphaera granulorum]PWJ52607.1 putative dehydrogenase [Quadrisphaera granulorum]SZE97657.1 Predicted dehydrogenase [Quadrisphaera granulorum]
MHVGVVGLGYWGSKHVRVLSSTPSVDRVSGFDPDPMRCAATTAVFPAVKTAPSFNALLDEVDAVVIATGPATHADLARRALERGRHVLVEKPLALRPTDAESLTSLAAAADLVLMVGHTFAFNPAVERLQSDIASGSLGTVLRIHSERLNLGRFQSECDVLWDLAPHDLSIIMLITGQTPTSVQSFGRGHIDPAVVDDAHLMLDFEDSGLQAVVHVSWLDPRKVRRVTVVGERRMAVFDDLRDEERLRLYDKGVDKDIEQAPHSVPLSYRYGDITAPLLPAEEPLQREDEHFVGCIRTGAHPLTDGSSGAAVTRILVAATTSLAEDGRKVSIR